MYTGHFSVRFFFVAVFPRSSQLRPAALTSVSRPSSRHGSARILIIPILWHQYIRFLTFLCVRSSHLPLAPWPACLTTSSLSFVFDSLPTSELLGIAAIETSSVQAACQASQINCFVLSAAKYPQSVFIGSIPPVLSRQSGQGSSGYLLCPHIFGSIIPAKSALLVSPSGIHKAERAPHPERGGSSSQAAACPPQPSAHTGEARQSAHDAPHF